MYDKHVKAFGIYLWSPYSNVAIFIHEVDELDVANDWIKAEYAGRLDGDAIVRVNIVNANKEIIGQYGICEKG